MRKYIIYLVASITCLFTNAQQGVPFPLGEKITFKIYYSWFALGEATMSLSDSLSLENGRHYYQTNIEAGTVGLFSWLAGINNRYTGVVSVDDFKAIRSEKHLDERDGKSDQWNTFDYNTMQTRVKRIEHEKDKGLESYTVDLTQNTYDIHGTYMYLRSQLGKKYKKGDSIMFKTYWVKKLYDFGMEYGGEERIKFNGDKVKVKKFYGLFPVSRTFPEEKAVTVYILEKDGLGIPLLIEAQMKIGKVRCELKSYEVKGQSLLTLE